MRYKALPLAVRSSTPQRQVPEPTVHAGRRIRDVIATLLMIAILPVAALIVGRAEASATLSVVGEAVPGSYLTVTGGTFDHPLRVQLLWDGVAAGMPSTQTRAPGWFTVQAQVPLGTAAGPHRLSAVGDKPGGAGGSKRSAPQGTTIAEVWVNVASASGGSATLTPIPTASLSVTTPSASPSGVPASATPTPEATALQDSPPPVTPSPTQAPPTPEPTPPQHTFADEFNGSILAPHWLKSPYRPYAPEVLYWDRAQSSVANGYLHIVAERLPDGGWKSDSLETVGVFEQRYGYFEARIKVPKGTGLWPAFWGIDYHLPSAGPDELDVLEACTNPEGSRTDGWDVSRLQGTVHWKGGKQWYVHDTTLDLSADFHVYGMDWRSDHVTFYFDGVPYATHTGPMPEGEMPVILSLAVGNPWNGTWCGTSDSTTPSPSEMLVDWVRVRP